jgi:hypothetical protein
MQIQNGGRHMQPKGANGQIDGREAQQGSQPDAKMPVIAHVRNKT